MSFNHKNDYKSTGIYRYVDNLKNFYIRILIRQAKYQSLFADQPFGEKLDNNSDFNTKSCEQHIFHWQQKIFSKAEIEWYKVDRNYKTFLEQKYHKKVDNLNDDKNLKYSLFTITDGDISLGKCPEKSIEKCPEKLTTHVPSDRLMYILFENQLPFNETTILCKIVVNEKKKLIKITPDFNLKNHHYYTLKQIGSNDIEYRIEIVYNQIERQIEQQKRLLIDKIYHAINYEIFSTKNLTTFNKIWKPKDERFLQINGEIEMVEIHDSYNICVEYYFETFDCWHYLNKSNIYDKTQKCYTNDEYKAYLSAPFEVQLVQDQDQNEINDKKWPAMFLKVLSFDYWNRKVGESYACIKIPKKQGRYSVEINTHTPEIIKPIDKLRQFFLGNSIYYKDDKAISKINSSNMLFLNCETRGKIWLNFNVIVKSGLFTQEEIYKDYDDNSIEHNILAVISAFQRAQKRMEFIREQLNQRSNI